jgi:hypothetical protein
MLPWSNTPIDEFMKGGLLQIARGGDIISESGQRSRARILQWPLLKGGSALTNDRLALGGCNDLGFWRQVLANLRCAHGWNGLR